MSLTSYPPTQVINGVTHLNQVDGKALDDDLMGPDHGFSVDQLMELAGLSIASAVILEYPPSSHPKVMVVCGPGNNGGDGLVAARHLVHFGYQVSVHLPKATNKDLFHRLATQCRQLGTPFYTTLEEASSYAGVDLLLDAVFGFSFSGEIRAPFGDVLAAMTKSNLPIVAVDIPSGWSVNEGDVNGVGLQPSMLISLSAPKLCARFFSKGPHYLGGRFLPPAIVSKFGLVLPSYAGSDQVVLIPPAVSSDL